MYILERHLQMGQSDNAVNSAVNAIPVVQRKQKRLHIYIHIYLYMRKVNMTIFKVVFICHGFFRNFTYTIQQEML